MVAVRSTLEAMEESLNRAICPEAVFGDLAGTETEKLRTLKAQYYRLIRTCHPDLVLEIDRTLATDIFQSLGLWESTARKKIAAKTYGDGQPYREPANPYRPIELTVGGRRLRLTGLIAEGTFASVHMAEYERETADTTFVKYARDGQDNDLLEREFQALRELERPEDDPVAERDFYRKQRVYVPCPLATFGLRDENRVRHQANILSIPGGQCFTAETLRTVKFPGGVEPPHVWWIFRRLLLTAWMAHMRGWIHGGITPDHVLIYPEAHGLVLLDWTCAAKIGVEHVPAVNPAWDGFYPPELLRKEAAHPSADLFMAAATAIYLLGGDPVRCEIPGKIGVPIRQALLGCLSPIARRRPQDAEAFHNKFGALLGPREFAEFVIPA